LERTLNIFISDPQNANSGNLKGSLICTALYYQLISKSKTLM